MKNWQREKLKSLEGVDDYREMILAQSLARKPAKPLSYYISLAEKLALENGGTLQTNSWLRKNEYNNLRQRILKYPEKFVHIKQHKQLQKTIEEQIKDAEQIASSNDGILPCCYHLANMGKHSLNRAIRIYPKKFAHIKQDRKTTRRLIGEIIKDAELLAKKNGGILHSQRDLRKLGYNYIEKAINSNPNNFSHIQQIKKIKTEEERVKEAEKLASENNDILPNHRWLQKNGHRGLSSVITNKPYLFSHLKKTSQAELMKIKSLQKCKEVFERIKSKKIISKNDYYWCMIRRHAKKVGKNHVNWYAEYDDIAKQLKLPDVFKLEIVLHSYFLDMGFVKEK